MTLATASIAAITASVAEMKEFTKAATISGSFTAVSESLASRLTAEEGEAEGSVVSSSAQIATDISGSFTSVSSSIATRFDSSETDMTLATASISAINDNMTLATASIAAITSSISSFVDGTSVLVSGSSISTGSFGNVNVGEMSVTSVSALSSSVASRLDSLSGDVIALSIALG